MRRIVRTLAAATIACLAPVFPTTGAAADEGIYVGLGAGFSSVRDSDVEGHAGGAYSPPLDATAKLDRGIAFGGAVGYRFADGLRVEGELGYRKNDLDKLAVREPGGLAALLPAAQRTAPAALDRLRGTNPVEGDLSALSLMANVWYDFDPDFGLFDGDYGLKPYVGGGVGLSRLSLSATSAAGAKLADDSDIVFAWQIGAGLGCEVGEMDGRPVVLSLDYRFYGTSDPTFTGSLTGARFDAEVGGSYVGVGVRLGL